MAIRVKFTDVANNVLDSNAFDPTAYNGLYGDGAAQQVVHELFSAALEELENDETFKASNRVQTINGFAYCNQPGLTIDEASLESEHANIRWYSAAVGGDESIHVPSWTGDGSLGTSAQVIAGSTSATDMILSDHPPGTFYFNDAIEAHAQAGARSHYTVTTSSITSLGEFYDDLTDSQTVRRDAIVAVEEEWDYLGGADGISSCSADLNASAPDRYVASKFTIGSKYLKWRFRTCLDDACTQVETGVGANGLLGPTLTVADQEQLQVDVFNRLSTNISFTVDGLMGDPTQASLVRFLCFIIYFVLPYCCLLSGGVVL